MGAGRGARRRTCGSQARQGDGGAHGGLARRCRHGAVGELLAADAGAVSGSIAGLLLKGLYFHPWLMVGVLIDAGVLGAAAAGWPPTLA